MRFLHVLRVVFEERENLRFLIGVLHTSMSMSLFNCHYFPEKVLKFSLICKDYDIGQVADYFWTLGKLLVRPRSC